MAIVRPFRGIRYNPEKVLLKQVIAPPYDVISPAMREKLVMRSQYNAVNIDLPVGGDDKYKKAGQLYQNWLAEGILVRDQQPAIYIYEQEYEYEGKNYVRTGFVGLLKLEPFGEGKVFPHEKTLSGPKLDRLELMKATKANLSEIFGLFMDPEDHLRRLYSECSEGLPLGSAVDEDGVKHSFWPVKNEDTIHQIQSFMKDKSIYIADGHHRYETALLYRNEMRKLNDDAPDETKPYDYVMMMFVNAYDQGLMIFPTHRVVDIPEGFNEEHFMSELGKDFIIKKLPDDKGAASKFLSEHKDPGVMVMIMASGTYGLIIDPELLESLHPIYRDVEPYLLEHNILNKHLHIPQEQILAKKGITFPQTEEEVRHAVANGGIGFLLKSTSIETVRKIAESGLVMPQKSTYFYPKLATGLLFNSL